LSSIGWPLDGLASCAVLTFEIDPRYLGQLLEESVLEAAIEGMLPYTSAVSTVVRARVDAPDAPPEEAPV